MKFMYLFFFSFLFNSILFSMMEDRKHDYREHEAALALLELANPRPLLSICPLYCLNSFDNFNKKLLNKKGTSIFSFDIDQTLLLAKQPLLLHKKNTIETAINLFEITNKKANSFYNWLVREGKIEFTLTDESVLKFLGYLKENNVIIVGLTARFYNDNQHTHNCLKKLGIDFSELSLLKDFDDYEIGLINGVIYTGREGDKATYVEDIINVVKDKLSKNCPYNFFHIDDSEEEIKEFLSIEHYQFIENDVKIQPIFYNGYSEEKQKRIMNKEISLRNLYKEYEEQE